MLRKLRIAVLLLVLLFVGLSTWLDGVYTKEWRTSLQVALYPVNADGSAAAAHYIEQLTSADFDRLETFFDMQRRDYSLNVDKPFRFTLVPALTHPPPDIPLHPNHFNVGWWSLQMRWFAWRAPKPPGPMVSIRMFLLYHDPAQVTQMPDSTGLQKGLLGIAHLYATHDMAGSNQVVLAHELLHTLGATDKYDLSNNQPNFPAGYADSEQRPLYPQLQAELMAGRIPLSATRAEQPEALRQMMIGPITAAEIGWLKK